MTRTIVIAAALALAVTLPAVQAQAQSPRTFVSAAGSDSNPCSFAAPCRHFQAAVNATSAGGEVDALDPAGYGPINITQSITIEGQGWSYIAPPANGNGITINNAGIANVTIHGVSLNGVGITGTTNGILFGSGAALVMQDCVIRNMTGDGIHFVSNFDSSLSIENTFVGNNAGNGVLVQPVGSAAVTAVFERVRAQYNGANGIALDGHATAGTVIGTATDTVSSNNGGGFLAVGESDFLYVMRSVAANNQIGVRGEQSSSGGVYLGQSMIINNATDCNGLTATFKDNYIVGNVSNVCGSGSFTVLKE
jgi:hypothetical protein